MKRRIESVATLFVAIAFAGCSQRVGFDGGADVDAADANNADVAINSDVADAAVDATGMDVLADTARDAGADEAAPDVYEAGPEDACVGQVCNGVCIDTQSDLANCGGCGNVCAGASWDTGRCVAGMCDPLSPPRPIAPLSTSRSASWRPNLRWELAPGTTGAVVELCSDRACMSPQRSDVDGTTFQPTSALTPGVWFWRLRARTANGEGTRWSPVWEFTVGHRDLPVATTNGTILDVNGDGFADGVVASRRETRQFWLYTGAFGTIPQDFAQTVTVGDPASVRASSEGTRLRSAGDVNGDGYGDLLFAESSAYAGAGRVYVLYGSAEGVSADRSTTLRGSDDTLYWELGQVVFSLGDVNGDGYGDVAVSNNQRQGPHGVLYVFLGSAEGLPDAPSQVVMAPPGAPAGTSAVAAPLGDFDGDGYADVVAGNIDLQYVFRGSATGFETTPVATLGDPTMTNPLYFNGTTSGDLNGDGFLDLVAFSLDPHFADVFLGSATGPALMPASRLTVANPTYQQFKLELDGSGDLDGDGYDDLVIEGQGQFGSDTSDGFATLVFRGGAGGPEVLPSTTIFLRNGAFATTAFAGDMDGDGYDDVVTGQAVGTYIGPNGPGHAFLYRGSAAGLVTPAAAEWISPDPNESEFGGAVALPIWHWVP